jgi:hypothetical protein
LKPDCVPQTDGGRMGSACANTLENVWRLTSENDQAKPDLFSRLACSTLLSKILATFRLSGVVLDRGLSFYTQVVPELVALHRLSVLPRLPVSFARLSKSIKLSSHCQALFTFASRPLKLTVGGMFLACESQPACRMNVPLRGVALRKISKSDQQTTLEPLGLTGDTLLGLAMACSLMVSLQGFRGSRLT